MLTDESDEEEDDVLTIKRKNHSLADIPEIPEIPEGTSETGKKLKVITKASAAKRFLKKNIIPNTKVTFDESGEVRELTEMCAHSGISVIIYLFFLSRLYLIRKARKCRRPLVNTRLKPTSLASMLQEPKNLCEKKIVLTNKGSAKKLRQSTGMFLFIF